MDNNKEIIKIIKDQSQINKSQLRKILDIPSSDTIQVGEYYIFEFIGCGKFSSVYKATKSNIISSGSSSSSSINYAIKKVERSNENDKLVLKEVKALSKLNNKHIIKLYEYFQDEDYHYLVLELAKETFSYLKYKNEPMNQEMVKIILSQVINGLDYLHCNNIIHNDIKLDNIMVNESGQVKLVDFNLCKFINDQNDRGDGTPGFAAPELYNSLLSTTQHSGYNHMVDWFSLGVLAFVLLIGDLPFCGDNVDEVYQNIMNGSIMWPLDCNITIEAMEFIESLLKVNPNERLGCNGVDQIKNHQFFKHFNW